MSSDVGEIKGSWLSLSFLKAGSSFWTQRISTTCTIALGALLFTNTGVSAQDSNSPTLELEDFGFWAEQCLVLAEHRQYEEALAACNEAIALNDNLSETADVWATRGEVLIYLGQHEDALGSLNQVLSEQVGNSIAMTYQCMARFHLGQYEEAVDTCDQALLVDGNWGTRSPVLAWYYRGLSLQQQGFLETALASFERAMGLGLDPASAQESPPVEFEEPEFNPQDPESLEQWLIANQPLAIEEPLARAEWCHTLHLLGQAGESFASSAFDRCDLEEAIALYEQALLLTPQDTVLWRQQGLALEQLGQYEHALTVYEQALALNPEHVPTLTRQCGVLNQLARYEAALAACEMALQTIQPRAAHEMAYRLNQQSIALLGLEQYEIALIAAERAIAVLPTYAPAHNSKAVSLWQLGRTFAAEQTIQTALETYAIQEAQFEDTFYRPNSDPWPLFYRDYGLAWFNQGRVLATRNPQNSQAIVDAYRQSLFWPIQKFDQHSSHLQGTQGTVWRTADTQDTERLVTRVMILFARKQPLPVLPHNRFVNTLLNLSAAYLLDDPGTAFNFAAMATELDSESFVAWHNLGLAALRSDELEEAYYAYGIANSIEPENIQVLMGIGETLTQQGTTNVSKKDEAIAIYEQILNIEPNYAPAQAALDRLTGLNQPRGNQPN